MKKLLGLILSISLLVTLCINTPLMVAADSGDSFTISKLVDGFTGADDISYANGSIIVADSAGNSVQLTNISTLLSTEIVAYGEANGNVVLPHSVYNAQDGSFYVSDNLSRLQVFDAAGNPPTVYTKFYRSGVPENFASIISFDVTLSGDCYVLDNLKNLILLKTATDSEFNVFCSLTDLGFTSTTLSKIALTLDAQNIFVTDASSVLVLDTTGAISTTTVNTSGLHKITDITVDHNDNLYILHNELDGTSQLAKLELSAGNYALTSAFDFTSNPVYDAKAFTLDFENGVGFLLTADTVYSLSGKVGGLSFFNTFLDLVPPIDYTLQTALSTQTDFVVVTNDGANFLRYPNNYNYALIGPIPENTKMILLADNVPSAPLFYYVLNVTLSQNNTVGYIRKTDVNIITDTSTPEIAQGQTILNNTRIYKYPSALSTEGNELIIDTVSAKTKFTLLANAGEITDYLGYSFYCINYNGGYAYIKRSSVRDATSIITEPAFVPNAKIIGSSPKTIYDTADKTTPLITLSPNTQVKLIKTTNGVAEIQFLVADVVTTGFVNAEYISDGSLNTMQVVGLSLGCLGIVLILLSTILAIKFGKHRKIKRIA